MTSPNQLRHPELVSGSILPPTRSKRWQSNAHRKVAPLGVLAIDQIDFPLPVPALELFLPLDGGVYVAVHFEMDEAVDGVFRGMSGQGVVAVLPHAAEQLGGDADIQRAIVLARKDIDAGVSFLPHETELGARWTLKQVQGDGLSMGSASI